MIHTHAGIYAVLAQGVYNFLQHFLRKSGILFADLTNDVRLLWSRRPSTLFSFDQRLFSSDASTAPIIHRCTECTIVFSLGDSALVGSRRCVLAPRSRSASSASAKTLPAHYPARFYWQVYSSALVVFVLPVWSAERISFKSWLRTGLFSLRKVRAAS